MLDDEALDAELVRMTDHQTQAIFAQPPMSAVVVRAPVSRLVVDVERFADDASEPMASRGMGAVYTVTAALEPLRRFISAEEREDLMRNYYYPHHARLEAAVSATLEQHDHCLIIDCHSFPAVALPYELADPAAKRPDVCVGTDQFHTGHSLGKAFVATFEREGWSVRMNDPFSGALVPMGRYQSDRRVSAVMVEINRRIYLDEAVALPLDKFDEVAHRIRRSCSVAISEFWPTR